VNSFLGTAGSDYIMTSSTVTPQSAIAQFGFTRPQGNGAPFRMKRVAGSLPV